MKRCYISGPMRGYPRFNFPAFFTVERELLADGWLTYNPAAKDMKADPVMCEKPGFAEGDASQMAFDMAAAMYWDFTHILLADAIVMLPGWEASVGARAERLVAELTGRDVWLAVRDAGSGEWSFIADDTKRITTAALTERNVG